LDQFAACFADLGDRRSGNAGLHDCHELLTIALCAVLCGGQGAVDMAVFARAKQPLLRGFLKLKNGPPSYARSTGCSDCSIRCSSVPRSGGSWQRFSRPIKVLSQLTTRKPYAHKAEPSKDLVKTVETLKPTILVGVSTRSGAFNQRVVEAMSRLNERPIIFARSNPTNKAECTGRAGICLVKRKDAVCGEQAAAFMAATHGRLTGAAGVCLSTLGPGALNLTTGTAYAQLDAMPMVMITGQEGILSRKQARFQVVDIVSTMTRLTKMAHSIVSPATIPSIVREAFRMAQQERPARGHRGRGNARDSDSAAPPDRAAGRR